MATPKLYDLARVTTASTGTASTITLGSAVLGFLTFALAGVQDGDTVPYGIKDGSNSEVGFGVWSSGTNTLTRNVTKSTNSNALISLSGTAIIYITARAEDFALLAPLASPALTGNVTIGTISNQAALNVGGVTGPGAVLTKHGNLMQLATAPADFNLRDLPPAARYDGDVLISRGGLVLTSAVANINARIAPLTLSTLGQERVRIDLSGNVGIGLTPSGTYKLEVSGAGSFTGKLAVGGFAYFYNNVQTTPTYNLDPGGVAGLAISWNRSGGLGEVNFTNTFASGFTWSNMTASATVAELMRLDSLANLGLGLVPGGTYRLEVSGAGSFTGNLHVGGATTLGTPLAPVSGGTGIASYTVGDLIYASGSSTLSKLADAATGNALISGGVGVAPAWGKITTSHTTGIAASGANSDITSVTRTSSAVSIIGAGQTTGNLTDSGSQGGSLEVQDTGGAVGNGGAVLFASTWGVHASIKGYVTNGGGPQGDLIFSVRPLSTDTHLTEAMRLTSAGQLTLTNALAVAQGGTGSTTASGARSNLGAAASGANSDITSLTANIGVGTTAPAAQLDVTSETSPALRGIASSQFSSDAASAFFLGRKARGTLASPAVIVSGDFITGFAPAAYDGANYQEGGFIGFQSSGTIAAGSVPTDLIIYTGTSANGSQRLIITATGAATFSGTLTVTGSTTLSSLTTTGVGNFTNTTDSTNTATGAIQTLGGLGVAKNIACGGYVLRSITDSIAASGTNTQAGATALTSDLNIVATGGFAVRLPTAIAGMDITVRNNVGGAINVFPATGAAINGLAANASISVASSSTMRFIATSTTQWRSA